MEAQHVHDADIGDSSSVQLRSLVDASSDEETSIGPAADRHLVLGGVAFRDEVLCRCLEVVKDVLLALVTVLRSYLARTQSGTSGDGAPAGLMPLLAVLASAPNIRHRQYRAL